MARCAHRQSIAVLSVLVPLLVSTGLTVSGCGGLLNKQTQLHHSSQGTVSLVEVVDWSFDASHPAQLEPEVISRALAGLRNRADGSKPVYEAKALSDLAPRLSEALARAERGQIVAFQVGDQVGGAPDITGGTLYVRGSTLYITPLAATSTASAEAGQFEFVPQTAALVQLASTDVAMGQAQASSFAVQYLRLGQNMVDNLPGPPLTPDADGEATGANVPLSPGLPLMTPASSNLASPSASAPEVGRTAKDPSRSAPAVDTGVSKPQGSSGQVVKAKPSLAKKPTRKSTRRRSASATSKPVPSNPAGPKPAVAAPTAKTAPAQDHRGILELLQKTSPPAGTPIQP